MSPSLLCPYYSTSIFEAINQRLLYMSVSQILIYSIPVIMALVCWFTNWLAVKMLFRPLEPTHFGLFKWQGILPKRQDLLAEKIGKMFAEELFLSQDIKHRIQHPDNIDKFIEFVEEKIDHYLRIDFPVKYPITSIFFGKDRRNKIKHDLLEQVHVQAPGIVEKIMDQLDGHIKMESLVTDRVGALSTEKLEMLLNTTLKKDLLFVGWLAGVVGFVIGLIQVLLIEVLR
jgi:uncharacterized membrane protein YheB (UPF0754 family)